MKLSHLALGLILSILAQPAAAQTFKIDAGHSSVSFRIRHIVSKVTGNFNVFSGSFNFKKGSPEKWSAEAEIDPASIDTRHAKRDAHLKNPDFFDVERCKTMAFKSTKVEVKDGQTLMHGDLTMHCVTKPVTLNLEFHGSAEDPWGNTRAGATATGKLSRKDWDIDYNMPLKAGNLMLGEEVTFTIELEGIAAAKKSKK